MKRVLSIFLVITAFSTLGQNDTLRSYDTQGNIVAEEPTLNGVIHGTCKYWTSDGMLWVVSEVDQGTTKKETMYSESSITLTTVYSKNGIKKTSYLPNGNIDWLKEWRKNTVLYAEWDSLGNLKTEYYLKNGCEIFCMAGVIADSIVFTNCYCDDIEVFEKEDIYVDSNDVPINKNSKKIETEYYQNGQKKSEWLQKGQKTIYFKQWNQDGVLLKEE